MFTWLQTHIQKHHKIVFGLLLVMIIIAFVFTIGNFGGFGAPSNPANEKRNFYGFNMNSSRDMSALRDWTLITFALDGRPSSEDQLNVGVKQRAVSLYLADELQIPGPTQDQFQDYVASRPAFLNRMTGEFSQDQYTQFLDLFQNNPSMNKDTLTVALAQNFRIEQVRRAVGGPGYVLPYQAVEEIKRRETVWSADLATLNKDTFDPEIAITDEALTGYYEQNQFRYETEPQVVSVYVEIEAESLVSEVAEPTEAELTAYYNRNRAKWPKNDEGATQPLDEIKDQVTNAYKTEQAKKLALDEANKLAIAIDDASYEETVQAGNDSIDAFLAEQELTAQTLPPFSKNSLPANSPFSATALQQVFSLPGNRFYTDGLPTNSGAAVIIVKEVSGTTIPPLEVVREAVITDYTADETSRLFNLHGQELQKELQAAVKAGKPFVETAESLNLTVEQFDDFTLTNPAQGLDNFELYTISEMDKGEVSNLVGFGDISTIVYIEKKDVPEVDVDSEQVQSEVKQLARYSSRATEAGIFNELITIGERDITPETL